jgi:DNA-binding transcriptional ArsR family regulator
MEIDRKTLKALAADTRLDILKSLKTRRKMPSELSKELSLAPSTVIEHLNKLEKANLVKREETGHKWIYYNLTNKGKSLVQPKYPVQFIIVLSLGILFVFSGAIRYMYNNQFGTFAQSIRSTTEAPLAESAGDVAKTLAVQAPPTDWLMFGLFIIGIALIAVSIAIRMRK